MNLQGPVDHRLIKIDPHADVGLDEVGDLLRGQRHSGFFGAGAPISGALEPSFVVGVAVRPVDLLKGLGGRAEDADELLVSYRIGGCTQHHAVVEDDSAKSHERGPLLGKVPLPLSQRAADRWRRSTTAPPGYSTTAPPGY